MANCDMIRRWESCVTHGNFFHALHKDVGGIRAMDKLKNRVLLVDDEAMNLTALTHILKSDYTIYVEKDGQGCLDTARDLKPDLILLDILMPAMNGFEVIAALKKDDITRDIPVIFVTGLNNAHDEEMGFVLGAADYVNKPFSSAVVKLRVKNQIQIINQMRQIKNLSITDPLTELGNRRFFYSQLEQEWNRAKRQQIPISLIVLDIDQFKHFNDTHGHVIGDLALRDVAQIINKGLRRSTDVSARWGGEEFAVILPDTALDGAETVAENICALVREHKFTIDDKTSAKLTISAGVKSIVPPRDDNYSVTNLVSDADKAMYMAKDAGRDRVCIMD